MKAVTYHHHHHHAHANQALQARRWPAAALPFLPLVPLATLLAACGGGDGGGNASSNGPMPILQVGMQRQYVGTTTRNVVYANPTALQPNNTLVYTYIENQNVLQAPSTAPASFDVNSTYTYSIVQDPGIGSVPVSQTVDNYENLVVSGGTQMTTTLAQQLVVTSSDETSNLLGNGPYTATTTTATSYPTARNGFSFPLQAGATMNVPQSSLQNIAFTDVNAGGAAPSNGANVGYTRTRSENDDGSYSYQTAFVNGNSNALTQNADGSGSSTFTSATATTTTTLGLPVTASGVTTLPVTSTSVNAATSASTTTSYSATDWYPNAGVPSAPLVNQTETVVGPTATLPTQCSGALLRPDIYEIDTTTTSFAPITGLYSVTQTRSFNGDGVTVCTLTQQTSYVYDLQTGSLVSTTTTQTNALLNAINY